MRKYVHFKWKPEWKRAVGKPKGRWADNIKENRPSRHRVCVGLPEDSLVVGTYEHGKRQRVD
jgi:hypothetical protein